MQSMPPLTRPIPLEERVEKNLPLIKSYYDIDDAYLNEVASSQVFQNLFVEASRLIIVKAALFRVMAFLRPVEFRVFRRYAPVHTIAGIVTFLQNADLTQMAEVVRPNLLVHLVIFTAGTEGADKPQNFVNRLLRELPSSHHDKTLRERVRQFKFEVKKTDLTQQVIDELHKQKVDEATLMMARSPGKTNIDDYFPPETK